MVICGLAALLLLPSGGRAHTPITTKILFNKEVIRILQENCLGCHRPGGIAPMSLATYEEARPWAKAIKEELLERRMPPWPAVRGFGEFRNAPRLTQRDVDAIVNWVEGGAPRGDSKLLPAGPLLSTDWPLGPPDLLLTPSAAHDVTADADEQRDVVLPGRLDTERWLTAADLRPGDASVVHCASFLVDGAQPTLLSTWSPGLRPIALPDGVALRIPAKSRLRLRIHYRGAGQPASDRSTLALYLAKTRPKRQLRQAALTGWTPPHPGRTLRASLQLPEAADAVAIAPRADAALASLQATVYRPDGTSEVLLWTRDPRADWQQTYLFKNPVAIPSGSRIEAIAHLHGPLGEGDGPLAAGRVAQSPPPQAPLVTLFYTTRGR